jgi:DNA-binding transcriptional LysR family regulator
MTARRKHESKRGRRGDDAGMPEQRESVNIPIDLLRSFVAIQEHGSFTKAAELLRLTQPAISAQIKRLQQIVGGEVFDRSSFGVALTEKGEVISRYARRILAMNDQILSLSGVAAAHKALRVGIPSAYAARLVGDVIAACRAVTDEHPHFFCESSVNLSRSLASGYLDVALIISAGVPAMQAVSRWAEPLCWACANDFLFDRDAPVPLLSWPNGLCDLVAAPALEAAGLNYSIVFVAADLAAQIAALRAGIGLYVLPERVLPRDVKIMRDPPLPTLPTFSAGIYVREGLEFERAMAVAYAIAKAIGPTVPQEAMQR